MFNASFIDATGKEITVLGLKTMPRFEVQYVICSGFYVMTAVEKADCHQCLEKYPSGYTIHRNTVLPRTAPLLWSFDSSIVSWAAASAYKLEESWLINVTEEGKFTVEHSHEDVRDMCTPSKPFDSLYYAKEFCQKEETRIVERLSGIIAPSKTPVDRLFGH